MKRLIPLFLGLFFILPATGQTAKKLRVLVAPGVFKLKPKNWHNTMTVSATALTIHCRKCSPIHVISVKQDEIASLRYGQNAYHHWAAGIVTGMFTLGIGALVGFWPHHQHFYSIDLKDGKVIGIQADKGDYKEIAGMLNNFTGLPIQVTSKDAHFLDGYNTKIENNGGKGK